MITSIIMLYTHITLLTKQMPHVPIDIFIDCFHISYDNKVLGLYHRPIEL